MEGEKERERGRGGKVLHRLMQAINLPAVVSVVTDTSSPTSSSSLSLPLA